MTADQQKRLTENVKRDGGLTSLPLVWMMQDETGAPITDPVNYEILSGNHRVISARDAGLEEIDCIVIPHWISRERRVEIQLSHNAVTGQDDLSVLEGLYEGLDLAGKEYSGLTDESFANLNNLNLGGFTVSPPEYQDITITFLPDDAEEFTNLLKRVEKSKAIQHVAHLDDFNGLFDTIVRVKEDRDIINSAVAIHFVVQLATERLAQLEAEDEIVETAE